MRRDDITISLTLLHKASSIFVLTGSDVDYFKGMFPKYKFHHVYGAYYLVSNYTQDEQL